MANLPVRTDVDVAADHVADHNTLHAFHNLIDAAGDLIVGTGVDTAGKLAKGSALQGLRVNAAGTALEYGPPPLLGSDMQVGYLAAGESTTSTTFTDLVTVGPTATVTVRSSGQVLLLYNVEIMNSSATVGAYGAMTFAVSGATTAAASNDYVLEYTQAAASQYITLSNAVMLTGLAAGSTSFTCKYRANTGTATFYRRRIIAIPL